MFRTWQMKAKKTNAPAPKAASQTTIVVQPQSRQAARGRNSVNTNQQNQQQLMHIAHEVCSITNPFCPESRNSKWPDQSGCQTLSVPVRMRYNMTTDASGRTGAVFTSRYSTGIIPGTVDASGVFTWNHAGTAYSMLPYAPAFTEADTFRVVSLGVKVTPITSAMNSQGIINMIELPPADDLFDYATFSTRTKNYPTYESLPLKSSQSLYGIARPTGNTAREFHNTYIDVPDSNGIVPFSTNDWSSLCVSVDGGAPNTAVAICDIYYNLEVTVDAISSLGFLTSRAVRPNTRLTNISTAITQKTAIIQGTDHSVDESFLSRAYNALGGAVSFISRNASGVVHAGQAAYAVAQSRPRNLREAGTALLAYEFGTPGPRSYIQDVD